MSARMPLAGCPSARPPACLTAHSHVFFVPSQCALQVEIEPHSTPRSTIPSRLLAPKAHHCLARSKPIELIELAHTTNLKARSKSILLIKRMDPVSFSFAFTIEELSKFRGDPASSLVKYEFKAEEFCFRSAPRRLSPKKTVRQ